MKLILSFLVLAFSFNAFAAEEKFVVCSAGLLKGDVSVILGAKILNNFQYVDFNDSKLGNNGYRAPYFKVSAALEGDQLSVLVKSDIGSTQLRIPFDGKKPFSSHSISADGWTTNITCNP